MLPADPLESVNMNYDGVPDASRMLRWVLGPSPACWHSHCWGEMIAQKQSSVDSAADDGQRSDVALFARSDLRAVKDHRFSSVEVYQRLVRDEAGGVVIVSRVAELPHVAERSHEILGLDGEILPVSLEFPLNQGVVNATVNL